MAAFAYRALRPDGEEIKGTIEADSSRQARALLRSRSLFPVNVHAAGRGGRVLGAIRIGGAELSLLTRQWSSLMAAGLTVEQSLVALIDQAEKPAIRQILGSVRGEVASGHTLHDAIARYPDTFPAVYRTLIRAGEKSGGLSTVLLRLADYMESRQALRQRILQAILYPAVVTVVALLVVAGLMSFVVPKVVAVFQHGKQALPWLTQILISISRFIDAWGMALLVGSAVLVIAAAFMIRRPRIRATVDRWLLRLPVVGRLMRTLDGARFAQTLAILVRGGVPLVAALEAGRDVLLLTPLRESIDVAIRDVQEGIGLARSLARSKSFPPLLVHLIAGGETTGRLGEMLEQAARQQQDEAQSRLGIFVTLLEPVMIVTMGGVVLLIVLAILQPIVAVNQLLR